MIVIGQNGSMEYRPNPLQAAEKPQPSETPLPDDRVDTITVTLPRQQYRAMQDALMDELASPRAQERAEADEIAVAYRALHMQNTEKEFAWKKQWNVIAAVVGVLIVLKLLFLI